MHVVLLLAVPLFGLCLAVEWWWGRRQQRDTYSLSDTISSLSQGLMSLAVAAVTPLFQSGLYALIQPRIGLVASSAWRHAWGWMLAIVLYDFCDYWLHRVSHESALFWAAHTVHHQSEHFNLSTALRQESFYAVMGWPFFLPMALLGMPLEQYVGAGLFVLLYQFWIHTEHIGRLGWLDRVFSTPSNHRVHHAVNPRYLDKNYGAVLVLWDRMFGTFEPETEPCVYGTVTPLRSWFPLWAVGQFYAELFQRMRATPRVIDKLRVLIKSPGWMPPGVAVHAPDGDRLQQAPFDPVVPRCDRWRAVLLFAATGAVSGLWLAADDLPWLRNLVAACAVAGSLSAVGAMLSRGGWAPPWRRGRWGWALLGIGLALCSIVVAAVTA